MNSQAHIEDSTLSRNDRVKRQIIEFGILGLILFSPLPAASVNEWSVLIIQVSVLVLFCVYLTMSRNFASNHELEENNRLPFLLFIGLFVFVLFQFLPLPKFALKLLSPQAYAFKAQFLSGFQEANFASLSLIPAHTFRQGLELVTYFLLGFLVIKIITEKKQFFRIYAVLVGMGIFEAIYGLFELYNKHPRILFYEKIYGLDSASGTFVNRNHFSGYLEMILPLAFGLIIARMEFFDWSGLRWKERLLKLSEKSLAVNLLISIGILVISLGIIFSKSRSGMFLLIFSFFLFFGGSLISFRKKNKQITWTRIFLVLMFIFLALVAIGIGIDSSLERFALDRLLYENRPTYWSNSLEFFTEYPVFGTGLGTFPMIYPDWETGRDMMRLYHAHNDYLEYLVELGIIGFFLLMSGLFLLVGRTIRVWIRRGHPEVKALVLGGLVSIFCMLFHSITDFNLHIPANMLLFSVVVSLTASVAFYKRNSSNREDKLKRLLDRAFISRKST